MAKYYDKMDLNKFTTYLFAARNAKWPYKGGNNFNVGNNLGDNFSDQSSFR